jgi:DNA-binding NarL/FixJ family response regulator
VLDRDGGFAIVAEAAGTDEAVAWTGGLAPDVVVFDTEHGGIDHTVARLVSAARDRGARVLVRAGAGTGVPAQVGGTGVAWLWHSAGPEEFVSAVRLAASGYLIRPPASPATAPEPGPRPPGALTAREHDVLRLLAKGLTNAEISAELILGESTVKTHVQNLLNKLGVRNRVTAAIFAHQLGLATSGP